MQSIAQIDPIYLLPDSKVKALAMDLLADGRKAKEQCIDWEMGPTANALDAAMKDLRSCKSSDEILNKSRPIISLLREVDTASPGPYFTKVCNEVFDGLAAMGWFLDTFMWCEEVDEINTLIKAGKDNDVDAKMIEHFKEHSLKIEADLSSRLPGRTHLFRQTFEAHRQGLYAVSVGAFLSQADGVCEELRNGFYFLSKPAPGTNERRPESADYVDRLGDDITRMSEAMLRPLRKMLPIHTQMKNLPLGSNVFNRHAILHGRATTYDTELNSYKAMSLLNYVGVGID